jgi:predicted nucleic acid-binding protein
VADAAVVNTSPLIFLSKAGLIDLLRVIAPRIMVPDMVSLEIGQRGPTDVTAKVLANTSWLSPVAVAAVPPLIQSWDLGAGESAVLAHAVANPGMVAIIDDGAGRRCAEVLGVPLSGTLGLVLLAKQRGMIPSARPIIATLKMHGMFLSERTIDHALALVGE